MLSKLVTALVFVGIHVGLCHFDGPLQPIPYDLTGNSSLLPGMWKNLTQQVTELVNTPSGNFQTLQNVTFSFGAFSVHDAAVAETMQFHHAGPQTLNATEGAKSVDGNSIYHAASITKVFTVYLCLMTLSREQWDTPLSQIFAELASNSTPDGLPVGKIYQTQWDVITPYMLANQLSGLPVDPPIPLGTNDILQLYPRSLIEYVPPVDARDPRIQMPCALSDGTTCSPDQVLTAMTWRDPTFLSFTQPDYSNANFALLGLVLQTFTGKSLQQLLEQYLVQPVGMNGSYYLYPGDQILDRCVITGNATLWKMPIFENNWAAGTGEIMTSVNDLASLGISILKSSLLSPVRTREWLKPHSFTSDLNYAVGMPWEIARYTSATTGKVTNIFAKSGEFADATSFLVLLPDFGVGFSILASYTGVEKYRHTPITLLTDLIVDTLIPTLEAQAAAEAYANFAGTYTTTTLNSSITISHNTSAGAPPGLTISSWISNGTDMLNNTLLQYLYFTNTLVLQPTTDDRDPMTGAGQIAFRHIRHIPGSVSDVGTGLFTQQYVEGAGEWLNEIGLGEYGGVGLDLFVFNTTKGSRATSLRPAAFRIDLERQE